MPLNKEAKTKLRHPFNLDKIPHKLGVGVIIYCRCKMWTVNPVVYNKLLAWVMVDSQLTSALVTNDSDIFLNLFIPTPAMGLMILLVRKRYTVK